MKVKEAIARHLVRKLEVTDFPLKKNLSLWVYLLRLRCTYTQTNKLRNFPTARLRWALLWGNP